MSKVRVLVKKVGEKPREQYIEDDSHSMQGIVGGYIEVVKVSSTIVLVCNEEGKLINLPSNFRLNYGGASDNIVGDIFFAALSDGPDDFRDMTDNEIERFKELLS